MMDEVRGCPFADCASTRLFVDVKLFDQPRYDRGDLRLFDSRHDIDVNS